VMLFKKVRSKGSQHRGGGNMSMNRFSYVREDKVEWTSICHSGFGEGTEGDHNTGKKEKRLSDDKKRNATYNCGVSTMRVKERISNGGHLPSNARERKTRFTE